MTPEQKKAFRERMEDLATKWLGSGHEAIPFLAEDIVRVLAASQPAPAADTGQAVTFVRNATALLELNAEGATTPRVPGLAVELLQQAIGLLSAHPAPLDAERVRELEEALRPFAECAAQIDPDEDDEEWAKFRLLIKDYRAARAALRRKEGEV